MVKRTQAAPKYATAADSSSVDSSSSSRARVAFLHPNLGIGGAERLVVDCASALKQTGHTIHFFTNYHDRAHCYEETRDGTLPVTVYGKTSDNLFGKFRVLIAILRMIWLTLIFAYRHASEYDVVFVDQVSHSIPILTWFTSCRVLFYCHFPDQLLAQRTSLIKRLYRWPFDRAEEWTTGCAHRILVNSEFTRSTFRATFTRLAWMVDSGRVDVLYPSIDFARYTFLSSKDVEHLQEKSEVQLLDEMVYGTGKERTEKPQVLLLTSINRFERKKNIKLAIAAFALFQQQRSKEAPTGLAVGDPKPSNSQKQKSSSSAATSVSIAPHLPVRLLICGGYDPANTENVEHYSELLLVAQGLGLKTRELKNCKEGGKITLRAEEPILPKHTNVSPNDAGEVYFLRSFTDTQRAYLLSHSLCILYTPSNEHFGIVPVEAMYMKRPVVACRSGGPMESVKDFHDAKSSKEKPTGFLCQPTPTEWRDTIRTLVASEESSRLSLAPSLGQALGEAGKLNVLEKFHFTTFQDQLVQHVREMVEERKRR